MQTTIIYQFPSAVFANRFKNSLKHWSVADVNARLAKDDATVSVEYDLSGGGYDSTASELDELASHHQGREIG